LIDPKFYELLITLEAVIRRFQPLVRKWERVDSSRPVEANELRDVVLTIYGSLEAFSRVLDSLRGA